MELTNLSLLIVLLILIIIINNFKINLFLLVFMVFSLGLVNLDFENFRLLFFLVWTIISLIILINFLNYELDTFIIIIINILSAIFIIINENLLWLYLILEIQTFSLFILIASNKNSIKSLEASIKYFILGAISSGFFLLGVSFFFKFNLNLNFYDFTSLQLINDFIGKLSYISIIISLFFKLAIFPFHFWIADIYEGSKIKLILLLSSLPKISIIFIIFKLIENSNFFMICSLLSIIIGSLGAINQSKIKRLLAYSGISHMGFIFLGLSLFNKIGYESSIIYLLIYMFSLIPLILLLSIFSIKNYYILDLSYFYSNKKDLGLILALLTLSIGGLPPLLGFLNKWILFLNLLSYNYIIICLISILFSMISISYYLRLIKILFFQEKKSLIVFNNILKPKKFLNHFLLIYLNFFFLIIITFLFNPNIIYLLSSWSLNFSF